MFCQPLYPQCDWITVLAYLIVLITIYNAVKMEYVDLYCAGDVNAQKCKERNGATYIYGKPKKQDDVQTLYQKIRISSRADTTAVIWRRSIVFSFVVGFIFSFLAYGRLPYGRELVVAVIVSYFVVYLFLTYIQTCVQQPIVDKITSFTHN